MSTPVWLSNQDLAERYGIPLATVRKWRHMGTGPKSVRLGRHVRTHIDEVLRFEADLVKQQAS